MRILKLMDWVFPIHFYQTNVAAAIAGSAIVGGLASSSAASSASSAQQNAANTAAATSQGQYDQTRADQAPWRNAGQSALSSISGGFGLGPASGGVSSGQFNHTFDANDLTNGLSPNYNFQLQQGLGAVNNQASVTGGLVGGNALKGISDYAQGSASSAYQQAFNNYNTNQTNIYNRLSNIAGLGQTANGQTAQAGMANASNVGSAQLAGGAAAAAGYIGQGNAISGAVNGIGGAAGWYGLNNGSTSPTIYGNGGAGTASGINLSNGFSS